MNALSKMFLGANWKTSVVGYALAVLTAIRPLLEVNATGTDVLAAAITALITAVFGRIAADGKPSA